MSRWRQAFERIGGPDAVTWPAFWVTFASSLIGTLAVGGPSNAPVITRIGIVTVTQVVSFFPLLLLRWTFLRRPPRPRPWVAVAGFIAYGVLRGLLLSALLYAFDAVSEPLYAYRITGSLLSQTVLLVIVAVVVSTTRDLKRSLTQLIDVQHNLQTTEGRLMDDVESRNQEVVDQVQNRLRNELLSLDSTQGSDSVIQLQRLASDVVRPMSHELATSLPERVDVNTTITSANISLSQVIDQMIDRPPFRPLLSASFIGLVLTNTALGLFGLARGLPLAVVLAVSVLIGSTAANRVLGLVHKFFQTRVALVAVVVASLAIGYASTAAASYFLPESQNRSVFIVNGGLFVSGVLFLIAMVTTVLRQLTSSERALAESTERLRRQLVRLRQTDWLQRQEIARALHGPVQAAVTAAALKLDSAVQSGVTDSRLVEDTRKLLLNVIDVLDPMNTSDHSWSVAVERIGGTWEGVCEVSFDVEESASKLLAADSIASAVAIDLITEAVSNAVRHGEARYVDVAVTADIEGLVMLTIHDDGHGSDTKSRQGLGSVFLSECALDWFRDVTPSGCSLTVVLPAKQIGAQ